jgi:hypothetical protein
MYTCTGIIYRIHRVLWKLLVECNALKILVQVLDSSSTEQDGLIKYVSSSLKLLASALGVRNPYNHTEGIHDHISKPPEHWDEMSYGSVTIQGTTKVS